MAKKISKTKLNSMKAKLRSAEPKANSALRKAKRLSK